jgi:hypothetical protein
VDFSVVVRVINNQIHSYEVIFANLFSLVDVVEVPYDSKTSVAHYQVIICLRDTGEVVITKNSNGSRFTTRIKISFMIVDAPPEC